MGALDGRKALVTGGQRSIGRGIALALAEAGCQVGINDLEQDDDVRETMRRIEAMGRKAAFYAADSSDEGQVERMMADFVSDFGTIDVLANNPYWSKNRPFLELEADNWSRTMDVCVKGFVLCSQAAARVMVEHGHGGSIASIASRISSGRSSPTRPASNIACIWSEVIWDCMRTTMSTIIEFGASPVMFSSVQSVMT